MKFEHLVQINDPLNPLIDSLTRDQLWRGLMRYIETPGRFDPCLPYTKGERAWAGHAIEEEGGAVAQDVDRREGASDLVPEMERGIGEREMKDLMQNKIDVVDTGFGTPGGVWTNCHHNVPRDGGVVHHRWPGPMLTPLRRRTNRGC